MQHSESRVNVPTPDGAEDTPGESISATSFSLRLFGGEGSHVDEPKRLLSRC